MIDTDRYKGYTNWDLIGLFTPAEMADEVLLLLAEVKRLREELEGREAYIKRLSGQLVRATKWAYKQVLHNDSAMMDFDDYVWGEEE